MNEDNPEHSEISEQPAANEAETAPKESAAEEPRGRKSLPFGHGLIETPPARSGAEPPQPEPPAEETPRLEPETKKAETPAPVERAKKAAAPFGFGVLDGQPAAGAEPEPDTVGPEQRPASERASKEGEAPSSRPTAFDILPFSEAPPPEHETIPGPDALPALEAGEAPPPEHETIPGPDALPALEADEAPAEEEAVEEESAAAENTVSSEPAAADAVSLSRPAEPEEPPAEPDEAVPGSFGEITEYEIIDPPDEDGDSGFETILPGPMQEVRFDERPYRRSRGDRSGAHTRPQTQQRRPREPAKPQAGQAAPQTTAAKKKLTPLQLAAIIAGAGIALAIVIWLVVTLAGN